MVEPISHSDGLVFQTAASSLRPSITSRPFYSTRLWRLSNVCCVPNIMIHRGFAVNTKYKI